MRAVKKAVDLINADKRKYVHYMIEEIAPQYAKQLTPDDFYIPRLRYVDPAPYTKEEFDRAYNWMLTWDLVGPNANYEKLVRKSRSSLTSYTCVASRLMALSRRSRRHR